MTKQSEKGSDRRKLEIPLLFKQRNFCLLKNSLMVLPTPTLILKLTMIWSKISQKGPVSLRNSISPCHLHSKLSNQCIKTHNKQINSRNIYRNLSLWILLCHFLFILAPANQSQAYKIDLESLGHQDIWLTQNIT
jgi:hypothetical protein